jgi:hypothetical protein
MPVSYFTGLVRSRSNVGHVSQRLKAYPILNGNNPIMYAGTPVKLSNGGLDVATNNAAVLGVAASFQWIDDTTGVPQYSAFIPANTSQKGGQYMEGYNQPFALVDDNPHGTYLITTDLSVSAGNIGQLARVTNATAGSTTTKRSSCELDIAGTAVSAGNAMFRIVGLYRIEDAGVSTAGANAAVGDFINNWDSPSTIVEVVFQNHLYG